MPDNSIIKRLLIKSIKIETARAKSFVLEGLDGWHIDYQPGQFITLVFYTKHGERRRSYSFSSTPGEAATITVKEVENGEFSRWMLSHLKEGDILHSSGIGGFFRLPEISVPTQAFCFLAAGSGITPCMAMIKTLLTQNTGPIHLIYSNSHPEDGIFVQDLQILEQQHPQRFYVKYLYSNAKDLLNKRLSRWLIDQLIPAMFGNAAAAVEYYLCGPFEYMQMAEISLRMYTEASHIHKEHFSQLPRLHLPEPPDKNKHRVTIHLGKQSYDLEVQYPKSVLATAKEKGIELPYSCEAGRCGSCIATCSSGTMWMAYNEMLTEKEVAAGRVLVCQAYPQGGDVTLRYDEVFS